MVWSWYYLIPICLTIVVAAIWVTVFFMSYKNTKNVKTAIAEAESVIEAFKGDIMAKITVSNEPVVENKEVTETPVAEVTPVVASVPITHTVTAEPVVEVTDEEKVDELIDSLSDKQAKKLFELLATILYGKK